MAFKRSFAVLFVLATSALAIPYSGDNSGDDNNSCKENEFYYFAKSCCLPRGGTPNPPSPPPYKSCPPTNWYWHAEKSCCVPKHPPPANPPPPQCQEGYEWNKGTQCCEYGAPTPTYPPHRPSETPKGGDDDHHHDYKPDQPGYNSPEPKYGYSSKRHQKRSASALCPRAYEACPVAGLTGSEYECLDTTAELRSCGGCASTGKGQDCTAIQGAWNVGCEVGSCAVYTCELGYKVAKDRKSCIKN